MEAGTLNKTIHIDTVNLKPGQYVTVHAAYATLEIRVTPTGKVEIYCDEVKDVRGFDKWYHIS